MQLKVIWAMIALCGVLATALLVKMTLMAFEPRPAADDPVKPGCVFPVGDPTLACESSSVWCVLCLEEATAIRCYRFKARDCELPP